MINRIVSSSVVLLVISIPLTSAGQEAERQAAAIAAIRSQGGSVEIGKAPGGPVVVALSAAKNPPECLPLLKNINNVCTLDL